MNLPPTIPAHDPPVQWETGQVITKLNPAAIAAVQDLISYPHDGEVTIFVMCARATEQAAQLGPEYTSVVAEALYNALDTHYKLDHSRERMSKKS